MAVGSSSLVRTLLVRHRSSNGSWSHIVHALLVVRFEVACESSKQQLVQDNNIGQSTSMATLIFVPSVDIGVLYGQTHALEKGKNINKSGTGTLELEIGLGFLHFDTPARFGIYV
jgi:hypothetical protein